MKKIKSMAPWLSIIMVVFGAIYVVTMSPGALAYRAERKEILSQGFTQVTNDDNWFQVEKHETTLMIDGKSKSFATAVGPSMIVKFDSRGNGYYKICIHGININPLGVDDTCKDQ